MDQLSSLGTTAMAPKQADHQHRKDARPARDEKDSDHATSRIDLRDTLGKERGQKRGKAAKPPPLLSKSMRERIEGAKNTPSAKASTQAAESTQQEAANRPTSNQVSTEDMIPHPTPEAVAKFADIFSTQLNARCAYAYLLAPSTLRMIIQLIRYHYYDHND